MVDMLYKIPLINEDMLEPIAIRAGVFNLAYFVKKNPDKTRTEDSASVFILDESAAILAIADGLGGHKGGELASKIAIDSLAQVLEDKYPILPLRECISTAYELANAAIMQLAIGAATTFTVAELNHDKLRFYNAGDSMGLVVGGRGKHKAHTIQHNPVGLSQEAGLKAKARRALAATRHIVSNYLGSEDMRIEISAQQDIARRDKILVFSDGVVDNFDVFGHFPLKTPLEICNHIAKSALKKMKSDEGKIDDLSIIVLTKEESDDFQAA